MKKNVYLILTDFHLNPTDGTSCIDQSFHFKTKHRKHKQRSLQVKTKSVRNEWNIPLMSGDLQFSAARDDKLSMRLSNLQLRI